MALIYLQAAPSHSLSTTARSVAAIIGVYCLRFEPRDSLSPNAHRLLRPQHLALPYFVLLSLYNSALVSVIFATLYKLLFHPTDDASRQLQCYVA